MDKNGKPSPPGPALDACDAAILGFEDGSWVEHARRASAAEPPLGMLGPYRLIEEIGRGGQGEVYKAVQPGTERVVALKRLAGIGPGEVRSPGRLAREVGALTRLSHPNIVTVYSAEMVDHHAVLVMEHIEGETIGRWADMAWESAGRAGGGPELRRVLRAFAKLCDGVAHAHQRGVIHRDLKPSNVIVDAADEPRVLDFGVARLMDARASEGRSLCSATGFAGTPAYAAPEQLEGPADCVDTRADVYSLGMLLYRVLAGRDAVEPTLGIAAAARAAASGAPAPSRSRLCLPRECDWIVRRATDPDPSRRYQTVHEFGADIRRLLDGHIVAAGPPSALYAAWRLVARHPWASAAAGAAAVAIATLGVVAAVQGARLAARSADLSRTLIAEQFARRTAEGATEAALAEGARAERAAAAQRELVAMLLESLIGAAPDPGRLGTRRDRWALATLGDLRERIDRFPDPRVAGEIRMRYGFILRAYGRLNESLAEIRAARGLLVVADQPGDLRHASLTIQSSLLLRTLGRGAEAVAECEAFLSQTPDVPSYYRADLLGELAIAMAAAGREPSAWEAVAERALAQLEAIEGPEARRTAARLREELGLAAERAGLHERALEWFQESLALARVHLAGTFHESRIALRTAESLIRAGRDVEAEPLARQACEDRRRRYGNSSLRTYSALVALAGIVHRSGRFEEAAELWARAMVPLLASNLAHPAITPTRVQCAAAMFGAGNATGARAMLAAALSGTMTASPEHEPLQADVSRVEVALRAGGWQMDQGLRERMGELGWLLKAEPATTPGDEE